MNPSVVCTGLATLLLLGACAAPLDLDEGAYRSRSYAPAEGRAAVDTEPELKLDAAPLEGLNLQRARDLALVRNHTVKAAAAAVEAARARIAEARAAFLPTVSGRIQRSVNEKVTTVSIPGGGSFSLSPSYETTGSAQLAISLFAFGRDVEAVKAARAELTTQILDERFVRQQLLFEVTQAWYRLHESHAQVQVAQDAVVSSARQLEDAKNIVKAGRATRDTELTAKVEWLARRQDMIIANNAVIHAQRILNVLLVREVDAVVTLGAAPDFQKVTIDANQLVSLGRRHSPTLVAFRSRRIALEHHRESIERSFAPEIVGAVNQSYSNFREATGYSTNLQATIAAEWTPVNGGRRIGQLQEIHANLVQLREQELQAHQDLELDVRRLLLDIAETESAVELAREAIVAAEENFRIISDRFRRGKVTAREQLEAQTTLSNARFAFNQSRFGHRTLIASLEAQIGVASDDWAIFEGATGKGDGK
ncbi:MAG: hypothetical protein CL908_15885 [Deltaproteobacteria bacterium]|nr:hypothetical protein [Deltaproteobacteria bacterium]